MIARISAALPMLAVLAGCAAPTPPAVTSAPLAAETLFTPQRVVPARLEYAPDRTTFPPVLTERFTYPTQPQANAAYLRLIAAAPGGQSYPSSIWLFGCKPGALDPQTARVIRYRGPVVHCATDFLDEGGRRLWRATANFFYYRDLWTMDPVYPPRTPVAWRGRQTSPKDIWWWLPSRSRYE